MDETSGGDHRRRQRRQTDGRGAPPSRQDPVGIYLIRVGRRGRTRPSPGVSGRGEGIVPLGGEGSCRGRRRFAKTGFGAELPGSRPRGGGSHPGPRRGTPVRVGGTSGKVRGTRAGARGGRPRRT